MEKTNKRWKRVDNPPEISCRVLIAMMQFGLLGRHRSTGTYWHLTGQWEIDAVEMKEMTPSHWMEMPEMAHDFEHNTN